MDKTVVHFGAGALGRGLIIPRLAAAGYRVVTVDADRSLVAQLTARGGYDLLITDKEQTRFVSLAAAMHPAQDALAEVLARADLITTSVRKENLPHVAAALMNVTPKTVICCENIERSGAYFASLLASVGQGGEDPAAQGWFLPDCMVDRICSAQWPASLTIESESYGAVVVEDIAGAEVPETFERTAAITARFQEKRILVNTYADGIAFLGLARGLDYLYQAAASREINQAIAGYMHTAHRFLQLVYQLDPGHLAAMAEKHRTRLANPAIKRPLNTVARDFLRKITAGERFIYPLAELLRRGERIDEALPFLHSLIDGWVTDQPDPAAARQRVLAAIADRNLLEKLGEAR